MNDRKLIYCVDDEENIREVYSYALKGAGLDVETFDGWSSLSPALQKRLPDLLLLDIMLDGADGYEILKKLRNNAVTADLPVIMVSAKTTEIDKVKGLDLGADDYIAKPFGVMELIARINAKLRSTSKKSRVFVYQDINCALPLPRKSCRETNFSIKCGAKITARRVRSTYISATCAKFSKTPQRKFLP